MHKKAADFLDNNRQNIIAVAVITACFTFILNLRNENRTDFREISDTWKIDNERLRKSISDYSLQVNKLNNQVQQLQTKIILLESGQMDLPFPMWLKGVDGTMLALNEAYEHTFLIPRGKNENDYIGRKDEEIWGEKYGKAFFENDLKVMRKKQPLFTIEDVPGLNGKVEKWKIIKYPRYAGRVVIGIGGVAIPAGNWGHKIKLKSKN